MQLPGFKFTLEARVGQARAGELVTPHGTVMTPVFMPVGTKASVKALSPEDVAQAGAEILLGNTYHLYLRPGDELVKQFGGLHQFMRWDKPILTDSGGYQVSSLGWFNLDHPEKRLAEIDDLGVTFKSYLDGSMHRFTPEKAMEIQTNLGADIIMAFDEATPDRGKEYAKEAMARTHDWLIRSKRRWLELGANNALFGIIQGGNYEDLRKESAEFVVKQDLFGVALGGGSIGQNPVETEQNAAWVRSLLPIDRPRYFMGVGVRPTDVVEAIKSGADMFDCVAPTKMARTGLLLTGKLEGLDQPELTKVKFVSEYDLERLVIEKKEFEADQGPIDAECQCYSCRQGFSRSYLRHLFKSKELLYYRLASIHNVAMMIETAKKMRKYILEYGGGETLLV